MDSLFHQAFTKADIVKIFILLFIAFAAWYFVFREYSKPFDLTDDYKRQQMIQEYEYSKLPPMTEETK